MGQRSQMYVIAKEDGKYYLTANYYQWNYGERMVSRTRGTLEQIVDDYLHYTWYLTKENLKLRRIMDVNWDMHDIVLSSDIVKEFTDDYEEYWKTEGKTYAEDFFDFCFKGQDNNDGQMYMYIDLDVPEEKRKVKLAFIEYTFDENSSVLDANEYLEEYGIEESYTEKNIEYIESHSELLDKDELNNVLISISKQFQSEYEGK